MELRGNLKTLSLRIVILLLLSFSVVATSEMFLEPGVFEFEINFQPWPRSPQESWRVPSGAYDYVMMQKSMYANSEIAIEVLNCSSDPKKCDFTLEWVVRQSDCDGVYRALFTDSNKTVNTRTMEGIYSDPSCFLLLEEHTISYVKSVEVNPNPPILCFGDAHDTHDKLNDLKGNNWECSSLSEIKTCNKKPYCGPKREDKETSKPDDAGSIADPSPTSSSDQNNPVKDTTKGQNETLLKNRVVHINGKDGRFIFIMYITTENSKQMNISLRVRMKSPHGYLSATQYPLLPFYGIMCAMYSILGLIWIVLLFRQWKDLLRIQFWISVVIILGLIEKAAFVAEYERHNNSGSSASAGIFFAEELSVLKRTMARMLVIIVSLGYGVTRPHLGRSLIWLLSAGILFFLLSSIAAWFRIFQPYKTNDLIALIPLSVLDIVLYCWIFCSLICTIRTLRLRRNLVKLWLYRYFTIALIFCVVATVIFLVWSIKAHRLNSCVKNWNEIWVDDAYWHILFCVILIVIMILFRPTASNQRYACSVLGDAVEDEDSKEPMMNDAFESVEMHSNKTTNQPEEVDDLQLVEDNIPAAVSDAALGAFDDSKEDLIMNVERNEME